MLDRSLQEEILEADSRSGKSIPVYLGDIDADGILDNYDFDGIEGATFEEISIELSSNLSLLDDAVSQITFEFEDAGLDSGTDRLFRIWTKDAFEARTESDLIRSGVAYDGSELGLVPGEALALYVEAVNPTRRTVHHDSIEVSASVSSAVWNSTLSDEIHLRGTNDPGSFPGGGSEFEHQCEDGRLCAVDDLDALTLEDGGVRSIDVLVNDHYTDLEPFFHQTNFSPIGDSGTTFSVINAPSDYEEGYWFQSATAEGTYEFGTFSIDLEFGSVSNVGELAFTSYVGEMTLRAQGRDEVTFSVVLSSSTNRNYQSDDFGGTTSQISTTVQTEFGSHGLLLTFDQYSAFGPFSLTGEISSTGVDIIDFTQPRHGAATPAFSYTPDEGTTATSDSFTYTLSTLLGENDTATVSILADPDVVSVVAVDDTAWEVPPHNFEYDKDEATFRFLRQDRPDEPISNNHSTTAYFTISSAEDPESGEASFSDWESAQIGLPVGYKLHGDGSSIGVYAVTIPSGQTHIDVLIRATNDTDYELDETLDFTIVDSYYPGFASQHTEQSKEVEARYKIGSEEATVAIVDRTADIDIEDEDEASEDTPGHLVRVNDDDNGDSISDLFDISTDAFFVDDDLVEMRFRSFIPNDMNFIADFFTLSFDSSLVRPWFNQDKSYDVNGRREINADTVFSESDLPHSVWLEAIGGGFSSVSLLWHESPSTLTGLIFDSISVITAKPDLKTDSNNNGSIDAADDPIENEPGKERGKVRVNTDDDNQNDITDLDEAPVLRDQANPDSQNEDDLKLLKIEWSDALDGLDGYEMSLEWASSNVKVWNDATKLGNEINAGAKWELGDRALYIEGVSTNSNKPVEVSFKLKVWAADGSEVKNLSDELIVTVIPERIIWLTGYWDPANTQGILSDFATQKQNFEKSGFTVKAFDFPVNYQQVSKQFWETAAVDRPIAILSFGLGGYLDPATGIDNRDIWELEPFAVNLPVDHWNQGSYDNQGNSVPPPVGLPTGLPLEGGVNGDFSPYGSLGLVSGKGILSVGDFGPAAPQRTTGLYIGVSGSSLGNGSGAKFDIAVGANGAVTSVSVHRDSNGVYHRGGKYLTGDIVTVSDTMLGDGGANDFTFKVTATTALPIDPTLIPGAKRHSSLPITKIEAAIAANNSTNVRLASTGVGCGEFLCEYLAYHDAWYVQWSQASQDLDIFQKAEMGGFTHVGQNVSTLGGKEALLTQLRVVISELEKQY